MNKLYNNEMDIVKGLSSFFNKIDLKLSKPQKKIIPHIITSIINAENVTTLDISKCYIDNFFFFIININSNIRIYFCSDTEVMTFIVNKFHQF